MANIIVEIIFEIFFLKFSTINILFGDKILI